MCFVIVLGTVYLPPTQHAEWLPQSESGRIPSRAILGADVPKDSSDTHKQHQDSVGDSLPSAEPIELQKAIAQLQHAISSNDTESIMSASDVIKTIKSEKPIAIILLELASDPNWRGHYPRTFHILLQTVFPETGVESLLLALEHDDPAVRANAALAVGRTFSPFGSLVARFDEEGRDMRAVAVTSLTAHLEDDVDIVRRNAAGALVIIQSKDSWEVALPELIDVLRVNDPELQANAAGTLSRLQSNKSLNSSEIAVLKSLLRNHNKQLAQVASAAIASLIPDKVENADRRSLRKEAVAMMNQVAPRTTLVQQLTKVDWPSSIRPSGRLRSVYTTTTRLAADDE